MHFAFDVKPDWFSIEIENQVTTRSTLLDWDRRDRLGVVVSEPLGALGAGLFVMLVATAFYDAVPKRRMRPLYPDSFLFHAGGPWGMHTAFDFAPDHKEIFVPAQPAELLRAINNRGITHLLIPDGPLVPTQHRYKEPEAAHDRLKRCFAYGSNGTLPNADVKITATPFAPLVGTFEAALDPKPFLDKLEAEGKAPEIRATDKSELELLVRLQRSRLHEIDEKAFSHRQQVERMSRAKTANVLTEEYRRIDVTSALNMLNFG